jgi:hypothetical protein
MKALANDYPLVVLGMHRSATSLLAQLLHVSGISMGERFVEDRIGNPGGLYEAADWIEWHERVLKSEPGGEWPLCGMWWMRRHAIRPDAWSVACREGSPPSGKDTHEPWGWKDPRTALFLPQWMGKYPHLRGIVLYRHPVDVYASLLRRGDLAVALDPLLAFETYATTYEVALDAISERPEAFCILSADTFVSEWDTTARKLQDWIGHSLDYKCTVPRKESFNRSRVGADTNVRLREYCSRAYSAFAKLEVLAGNDKLTTGKKISSKVFDAGSEAALLALERSLAGGESLAQRRSQLRIEIGKSLHQIGEQGAFLAGKQRYYEEQIHRLEESLRIAHEQRQHLTGEAIFLREQVAFMQEHAGVEAWKARKTIMQMRQTLSWRITTPLRKLRQIADRFLGSKESGG